MYLAANTTGELVRGRCKSTNQCDYCAKLGAIENTELLWLDALHGVTPTIYVCLTTRSAVRDPAKYYKSRELILRDLRVRWPAAEVAWLLEFTTGYGARSGGLRRPHWNGLLKGIPDEDVGQAGEVIRSRWTAREDALAEHQDISLIRDVGGLTKYIAQHFQKESQAPPAGWRGHRFMKSRGYLWTTTPEAREAARASLRFKRAVRAVEREAPELYPEDVDRVATARVAAAAEVEWIIVRTLPGNNAPPRAQRPPMVRAHQIASREDAADDRDRQLSHLPGRNALGRHASAGDPPPRHGRDRPVPTAEALPAPGLQRRGESGLLVADRHGPVVPGHRATSQHLKRGPSIPPVAS
jgi:hypothetical protein